MLLTQTTDLDANSFNKGGGGRGEGGKLSSIGGSSHDYLPLSSPFRRPGPQGCFRSHTPDHSSDFVLAQQKALTPAAFHFDPVCVFGMLGIGLTSWCVRRSNRNNGACHDPSARSAGKPTAAALIHAYDRHDESFCIAIASDNSLAKSLMRDPRVCSLIWT